MSELEKTVLETIKEAELSEGDLKLILGVAIGVKSEKDRQRGAAEAAQEGKTA